MSHKQTTLIRIFGAAKKVKEPLAKIKAFHAIKFYSKRHLLWLNKWNGLVRFNLCRPAIATLRMQGFPNFLISCGCVVAQFTVWLTSSCSKERMNQKNTVWQIHPKKCWSIMSVIKAIFKKKSLALRFIFACRQV